MLNKEELKVKLINNDGIKPFNLDWGKFHNNSKEPENLKEYKQFNYDFYEDWILWKYANGEDKQQIKAFLIDKFDMIKDYKNITEFDIIILNIIVELLNKYFSIQLEETHQGILNDRKVTYTWNRLLRYELIEHEVTNKVYYPYRLKIDLKDWTNHKVNGENIGKFSVDHLGNILV